MEKLPQNYTDQLFQTEMQLDETPTLDNLIKLNDLFGIGIDYYLDQNPNKARYLQKKVVKLFSRGSILQILENKSAATQMENRAKSLNKKLKTEVVKFHTESDVQIKDLIRKASEQAQKVQKLKNKAVLKQEQTLANRIKLKKSKSCKNITFQDAE